MNEYPIRSMKFSNNTSYSTTMRLGGGLVVYLLYQFDYQFDYQFGYQFGYQFSYQFGGLRATTKFVKKIANATTFE